MSVIFFFGSLRDRALLEAVLGREVDAADLRSAWADGYCTRRLVGEAYPLLLPAAGRYAEGVILQNASASDLDRLAFFEEAEYSLSPITVTTDAGRCKAHYFRGTEKPSASTEEWDFETWRRDHRTAAIEATLEYMHHFGRLPVEEIDRIWPGVKHRAYQRARALAAVPPSGGLGTDFGADDVEQLSRCRAYTNFLAVQELRLRHRRFDGGWSEPLERVVVAWGDAVSVLPYDPRLDSVLLIEQFRPAPAARGDRRPWCLEVIAGRLDTIESPEATARREAVEEAGVTLGRLVEVGAFYPSPGHACEHVTSFVGEADLNRTGGVYGLDQEGEDIRSLVLSFEEAIAAAASGAVNTAYALLSLYWLAANRERLRAEWR